MSNSVDTAFPGDGQVIALKKGKRLFEGERAVAIYLLQHGCVRLEMGQTDGRREIVGFLFPGDTLCGWPDDTSLTAEAVSDGHAIRFSMSSLVGLMRSDPDAALDLFRAADRTLSDVAEHVGRMLHQSAADRLKWFLRRAAHSSSENGRRVDLPMRRQDIADFLGLAPETVSRLFRALQAKGELRKLGRRRYLYGPAGEPARGRDFGPPREAAAV